MAMLNNQMVYQLGFGILSFIEDGNAGTPEGFKLWGDFTAGAIFQSPVNPVKALFLNFTWVFETLLYVFLGFLIFLGCFPGLFPSRRRSQAFCMFHGAWFSAQWGELMLGSLDQRGITEGEFASMQPVTDGWEVIYCFWYESAQENW